MARYAISPAEDGTRKTGTNARMTLHHTVAPSRPQPCPQQAHANDHRSGAIALLYGHVKKVALATSTGSSGCDLGAAAEQSFRHFAAELVVVRLRDSIPGTLRLAMWSTRAT